MKCSTLRLPTIKETKTGRSGVDPDSEDDELRRRSKFRSRNFRSTPKNALFFKIHKKLRILSIVFSFYFIPLCISSSLFSGTLCKNRRDYGEVAN